MTDSASASTETPRTLPRGRHGLGDNVVRDSQRLRMIEAITAACAQPGYASVSVANVIERSGVSRKTFYEQFDKNDDCLIAAYEAGLVKIGGAVAAAVLEANSEGKSALGAANGGLAEMIRRTVSMNGPEALPGIKEHVIDIAWTVLSDLKHVDQ